MTKWLRWAWIVARCWLLRRPVPLRTFKVEELPDQLDAKKIYVVGENDFWWFAAMLCPCGCGATLHMNLLPDARPRWNLTAHKDSTVSLHPSVWRVKDCRSHFFLRRGLIEWCSSDFFS
jgi:hypothetical protein